MVSSTNCVIEIRDIKMVYKTCGDCLNFLKNIKSCVMSIDDNIIHIKKDINIKINNIEYEYDNAIKKLSKIKSKESLDLVDLEGYSEYTESNSSNTDDEDKEEYEKYGILDESEDDYEEIIEGYDI